MSNTKELLNYPPIKRWPPFANWWTITSEQAVYWGYKPELLGGLVLSWSLNPRSVDATPADNIWDYIPVTVDARIVSRAEASGGKE